MDEKNKVLWANALTALSACPEELRESFARLTLQLALCYDVNSENRAVVLLSTAEHLHVYSAGADEEDTAALIHHAALMFWDKNEEGYVN